MDRDFETLIEAISAIRYFHRFYGDGPEGEKHIAAVLTVLKEIDENRGSRGLLSQAAEGLEKGLAGGSESDLPEAEFL